MWQLLYPTIRNVLGDCISVITMHLILVIFALDPCIPVICVFSPSISNTTYTFKERSGQEEQPKGEKKGKNPKANLTWLGAVTLSSWKEGGRQSVGDRIESATFATSARDSYWFYNYWNWKASRSLYSWLLRSLFLPTTLHLLRLQPSADSHSQSQGGEGETGEEAAASSRLGVEREMGSKPRDLESACLLSWPHLVSRGLGSESLSVETFAISILFFSRRCITCLGVFQPESFGLSWLSQINTCPQTIRPKGKGVGCLGSHLDWSDPCYVSLDRSCVCFLPAKWDSQDWTFPRLLVKDRMSQCLSSASAVLITYWVLQKYLFKNMCINVRDGK